MGEEAMFRVGEHRLPLTFWGGEAAAGDTPQLGAQIPKDALSLIQLRVCVCVCLSLSDR